MTPLTTNEQAFIAKMTQSEELARHGFTLILKREDFDRFFEPLRAAGLFAPDRNPAPEPAPEEGYVRIPYWSALDYLLAISKRAGSANDLRLANAVMDIIRRVSQWRDPEGEPRHNYHTAHKFTEMFGQVPTAAVTGADFDLISTWLNDRFERMLVGVALDEKLLPHLLDSTNTEDWDKAVIVLRHATAIAWVDEPGTGAKRPRTLIEDYWLRRLLQNHIRTLATRRPEGTIEVLVSRIRDVYSSELHKEHSTIYRPAIEDHAQNHEFRAAENRTVEALRDALLTWAANEPDKARPSLESLLADESEILRRIAVYIMDQHWPTMRVLFIPFLQRHPFTTGHLHELYALLSNHFSEFTQAEQETTIATLREVPPPADANEPERTLKRVQQRWLSAIVGKGSRTADDWMKALSSDQTVGPTPDHPDFASFMTSWSGPGESPYSVAELVGFAGAHILTDRLNSFEEKDAWRGPSFDGLTNTLQNAARSNPGTFARSLADLLTAKCKFQQAVIRGLQQAWEAKQQEAPWNWDEGWEQLITFFEHLAFEPAPEAGEDTERRWLLATIADCLRTGTQQDDHAFTPRLLPRVRAILDRLLQLLPATTKLTDDPMTTAINTPKGRAIEAFVSEALRTCRVADQTVGNHNAAWTQLQPIFDRELRACEDDNLEFSTLSGAYLAQLEYLNAEWITENIPKIFPAKFPQNEQAALAGLAYAAFTRQIYEHLLRAGVLDRALNYDLKGREAREKVLERIAAAYIWGIEPLDSPRFQRIFDKHNPKEIEVMIWLLRTLRHQNITAEQKERILEFWARCVTWAQSHTSLAASLLSALSALATYITAVDNRARTLLLAVAPYVHVGHQVYEFTAELLRLSEHNPDIVMDVLDAMIAGHVPDYDYEDTLKKLLRTLAANGKKKEVLRSLDLLISLPGMHELFNDLTRPAQA